MEVVYLSSLIALVLEVLFAISAVEVGDQSFASAVPLAGCPSHVLCQALFH